MEYSRNMEERTHQWSRLQWWLDRFKKRSILILKEESKKSWQDMMWCHSVEVWTVWWVLLQGWMWIVEGSSRLGKPHCSSATIGTAPHNRGFQRNSRQGFSSIATSAVKVLLASLTMLPSYVTESCNDTLGKVDSALGADDMDIA